MMMVRVWDPLVRIFHWSLVASFALAWITSDSSEAIHQWAGLAAAALILLRLAWGVLGTPYARFSQFLRRPGAVLEYLGDILSGREARHIGHNPAGGAMVVAMVVAMLATAFTGWLMTTDTYYGIEWIETAHGLASHGLLALVFIHLAGVALASFRHGENLVLAMITGRKREAAPEDIG